MGNFARRYRAMEFPTEPRPYMSDVNLDMSDMSDVNLGMSDVGPVNLPVPGRNIYFFLPVKSDQ